MLHCRVHRNEPHCFFKCVGTDCKRTFCSYAAFKAHFYRAHNVPEPSVITRAVTDLKCAMALCERQFHTVKELISHLKQHIEEGQPVACPFAGCKKTFTVKSSFTAHMSRNHQAFTVDSLSDLYRGRLSASEPDTACTDAGECSNDAAMNESTELPHDFSESFLRNLCLFYLKLQGQLLLPASTIQKIVEEIQNVHELGQEYTMSKLHSLLKNDMCLTDDSVAKICDCVKDSDLFSSCHQGPLRTTLSRAQTFKKMFNYIEPKKVKLGNDENMSERFAYYIPLKETLNNLLESELWKNSVSQHCFETDCNPDDFGDISDGKNFTSNQFFIENQGCLKLILYQDAFEIVNPLGSAKKKHKVVAVYLSVANLPVHVRSNTDHMSLVLLCGENDLEHFGCAKAFSELLEDLSDLEENGITVGGETVKGTLYCIAGDNLGSHGIGGFTENFSRSQYFCRYCEIILDDFHNDPNVFGPQCTPESYDSAVCELQGGDSKHNRGIKVNSVFNALKSFHVCLPGLPPCLGHDIFEGILSYDVALYLKYFIKKKKWFTYSLLNQRIKQFKYKGTDALTKPCAVNPEASKLSGQAIQNWNFLRLLPVIIGDKIQNPEDDVWQLMLQLKDIVDFICAQKNSLSQVTYLDVLIQEYLESRKCQFPETPLKPKHHFLRHYPGLILKFGPLIKVWTMRFESRHSYFKRCARHMKNFKNICLTLSERHQMFQAYLSAGPGCIQLLHVKDSCTFYPSLYSDAFKHAVEDFGFSENNTRVSTHIQYKGTSYQKGHFVVSKMMSSWSLESL